MSENKKLNVLFSFVKFDNNMNFAKLADDLEFIIKAGKDVDIGSYIEFITTGVPEGIPYFNLAVVGDEKATFNNYMYMRSVGLNPIPISIDGEGIDKCYLDNDYVGIVVDELNNRELALMKLIMDKGVKGRKCHWFNFNNLDFIKYYKPYSLSTTSWLSVQKNRKLSVLTESGMKTILREDLLNAPLSVRHAISNLGYDITDLYSKENWFGRTSIAHEISTLMRIKYANLIERKVGTKTYFEANDRHDLEQLITANSIYNNGVL